MLTKEHLSLFVAKPIHIKVGVTELFICAIARNSNCKSLFVLGD